MLTQRMHSPFSAQLFAGGTTDSWRDCGGRDAGRGRALQGIEPDAFAGCPVVEAQADVRADEHGEA